MNKKSDIIYGIRTVIEAVKSGKHLERVFIQKNLKGDLYKELMLELHQTSTPISKVPSERINKFTKKNHQGVVALMSPVQYHTLEHLVPQLFEEGKNPLILVLDEITDIRNFGAIARTAECLGVNGIVIPSRGGAQVNEDAVKTSAGAFNYLPVCREKNLQDVVRYLQESGINVVACSEKTDKLLSVMNFTIPTAIIMGSEENGISPELMSLANDIAKVPMSGSIESLNVGVAAGMALYEVQRQRAL
ncbi:23S rRNA (guanosine2251-2'-O)-methyltransferase [Ekhidna lutea]|uniref:23S rRNA (Guanosine2251-2'-O)-methyltransferase n=1 Tax=Ekhidna lutea TaxID=447679 RepID=A0A239FL38_EKHLU|nr:23S rRNA (guanosine(2251)-2'-O)-methyltransferase RlmB [Ekhidna lutea]SNS57585.1 23S rRNA (guanosine2251-2'-O)-methyltransferase [Ekhidna lutea]